MYRATLGATNHVFDDLKTLLAKATPLRSGDQLAGVAAESAEQRVAAQYALADVPLTAFLEDHVIPYETDEVTRLIIDTHDMPAFAPIAHLTVGGFRDGCSTKPRATRWQRWRPASRRKWRRRSANCARSGSDRRGGEMRRGDALPQHHGLPGRLSVRLQPNHPTDDRAASPRASSTACCRRRRRGDRHQSGHRQPRSAHALLSMLDEMRITLEIPTQVLRAHACHHHDRSDRPGRAGRSGVPVDRRHRGGQPSFGITLALLREAHDAALSLQRGTVGDNVMYFETGQGSALSANAHHGVDQQTCEARAYAVARAFAPLLVNTVVGFIGPEYLYDGKQITRAGLEDHFCGKLMGVPMGCDVCYTNHAEADQDDMDKLLTLLVTAGVNFIMGVPGADDMMLNYQSTSFHDALVMRELFGRSRRRNLRSWLEQQGLIDRSKRIRPRELPQHFRALIGVTTGDA